MHADEVSRKIKPLFEIRKLAPVTQLQDLGRKHNLHQGFSQSGAMDSIAFAINNSLLNNTPNATQLEIAPGGLQLRCLNDCTIAISGAYLKPTINDKPLINFCASRICAGDILNFGFSKTAQYAYLAIVNGFDSSEFLGSHATCERLSIFTTPDQSPLQLGDILYGEANTDIRLQGKKREHIPSYLPDTIDVLPAYQHHHFSTDARYCFIGQSMTVTATNRMGIRLNAIKSINWQGSELRSEGIVSGAVQVPPDGNPIVLQKDAQSIGGYPKIGVLTEQSQILLAQKPVGSRIQFRFIEYP